MKKTKVNRIHYGLKAKMVEFAGWEMPLQYSGIVTEHMAVRTTGGIFDVSHMGEISVCGKEARDAVQFVTSNDVSRLVPGKIQYSALLTETGCFVDDLLVYMIEENEYLLVVNAANTEKDFRWIFKKTVAFSVKVENLTDQYTQIALQGPMAQLWLQEFTHVDLSTIPYYHFRIGKVHGREAIISRTGYTGEDGFEIYFVAPEEAASSLFLELVEHGGRYDALPAGLAARDTLRLEAAMALYGNDIDDTHTVLEADLSWILKLNKATEFIGRNALMHQQDEGIRRKLVGFQLEENGVARHGYPVFVEGRETGTVTSGTFVPFLKKPVGMAYLPVEKSDVGSIFNIKIRDRLVSALVVEKPFYKRVK